MDNLIAAEKSKPFIIVMANSYVPGAAGPGRGSAAPAGVTNGAPPRGVSGPGGRRFDFSAFERVLIDDLIPFIDGSRENGATGKANVGALKQAGINSVFYQFAPLLFSD
jgi:hypothetical protein